MKDLDIETLILGGYLQEVNRRFFHPLGLALYVKAESMDGPWVLGGVGDYRDDPEGIVFESGTELAEKARLIEQIELDRKGPRMNALGFWVQPSESP